MKRNEGAKEWEMTIKTLAEAAAERLNERLVKEIFDIIQSDKDLHADYKELLGKSSAKDPKQAVNSAIGREIGRIYGLRGGGAVHASLIKTHSKLIKK